MTFRNDLDALDARHDALATELAAKTRELHDATMLLEDARARARLPVLENIRIASPCRADWNAMTGDERTRHCHQCDKQVFNLSELTRVEAEALIREKAGDLCARYYQRPDGTILLADCSIAAGAAGAASAARRRKLVAAASLVLLGTGAVAAKHHHDRIHADSLDDIAVPTHEVTRGHFATGAHREAPPPKPLVIPAPPAPPVEVSTQRFTMGAVAIHPHDD